MVDPLSLWREKTAKMFVHIHKTPRLYLEISYFRLQHYIYNKKLSVLINGIVAFAPYIHEEDYVNCASN
ncbi:hypothetical protein AX774_g507 [Zancudomyces culisetae]|uniref:Uncharacterized protein n=1 Tax=Zancudomyces culisetae TaxID=1213189 RepID=A0A1R1PY90_ZANCU|nr:hypothetical protein AX774_g507 [Zancudomyces culisetae]|eukprot:OMH85926.1 hypothetical protein AX774_g507 [Zancudomyces culisetae]